MKKYENYALGNWVSGNGNETVLHNAITGRIQNSVLDPTFHR